MDMQEYKDERESTSSCFKLECGHAFHTKCIITCLQRSAYECPQCNKRKSPEQQLTKEGLAIKIINEEIRKDGVVRISLKEFREAKTELKDALDQLKKDTKEFIEKRKVELLIDEKKKYFNKSISNVKKSVIDSAKNLGPRHIGAINALQPWKIERILLNTTASFSLYRLKNPRLYVPL